MSRIVTATSNSVGVRVHDIRTSGWTEIQVDYVYAIDQTALGISHLTVEEMDAWFNVYQEIKEKSTTAYLMNKLEQLPTHSQIKDIGLDTPIEALEKQHA